MQNLIYGKKKLLHGWKLSDDPRNSADLLYLLGGFPRNNYILVTRTSMQFCQRYYSCTQFEESHCLEANTWTSKTHVNFRFCEIRHRNRSCFFIIIISTFENKNSHQGVIFLCSWDPFKVLSSSWTVEMQAWIGMEMLYTLPST